MDETMHNLENSNVEENDGIENTNNASMEELMSEIATLKATVEKQKNAVSKANSEAANYKKALREKQTAQEQEEEAKREQAEREAERVAKLEEYVAKNEAMKRYMNTEGMSPDLAEKAAEAFVSNDQDTLSEIHRQHMEAQRKAWETEFLKSRPQVSAGFVNGKAMTKEEIAKIKDPAERRKAIANNLSLFN